jgi:hypothetical protein
MTADLDQAMTEFVRTAAMHVLEIDAEDRDDYITGLHESWVSIGLQSGMDEADAHQNADTLADSTREMVAAIEQSGGASGGTA